MAFGEVWKESLTELSGGQRSLLALSLILALLLFKPAPLYILDEVCCLNPVALTVMVLMILLKRAVPMSWTMTAQNAAIEAKYRSSDLWEGMHPTAAKSILMTIFLSARLVWGDGIVEYINKYVVGCLRACRSGRPSQGCQCGNGGQIGRGNLPANEEAFACP